MTAIARKTYLDSFNLKHECKMCGTVEIDQALPPAERRRQADAAYRAHMTRLSHRRRKANKTAKTAKREAKEITAELRRLDDAI